MLLDEGHLLGASLGVTSKLRMACALQAERRWVMTGTPTPTGRSTTSVEHLQPLLAFLRQVSMSMPGVLACKCSQAAEASSACLTTRAQLASHF